jgi:arsenate reductase (glutaredoxin)
MEPVKIWHNPRCRKSREGLQYLKGRNIEPEIFHYLEGFSPADLLEVLKKTKQPLNEFIRKNEKEYKELHLREKILSKEEFAEIASKHPKLLQRPIVIKGGQAVLARPAEKIDDIL